MEDYLVDIKKTKEGRDQLIFSGQLTIEYAGKIKSELIPLTLACSKSLDMIIKEAVDIDLSFLQLVKSFTSLLKKQDIAFTIRWQIDEEQKKMLRGSGFAKWL